MEAGRQVQSGDLHLSRNHAHCIRLKQKKYIKVKQKHKTEKNNDDDEDDDDDGHGDDDDDDLQSYCEFLQSGILTIQSLPLNSLFKTISSQHV